MWLDYNADKAGQCCRVEKSLFLSTRPPNFRNTQQRTCLCGICGAMYEATEELVNKYPVVKPETDTIGRYHRFLSGSRPIINFYFTPLYRSFVVPEILGTPVEWSAGKEGGVAFNCAEVSLQGLDNVCVAEFYTTIKVSSMSNIDIDKALIIKTASTIASISEWRLVLKMKGKGAIKIRADTKLSSILTDLTFENDEINLRMFFSSRPEISSHQILYNVLVQDDKENPPKYKTVTKKTDQHHQLFHDSRNVISEANKLKKKKHQDRYYPTEVEEVEDPVDDNSYLIGESFVDSDNEEDEDEENTFITVRSITTDKVLCDDGEVWDLEYIKTKIPKPPPPNPQPNPLPIIMNDPNIIITCNHEGECTDEGCPTTENSNEIEKDIDRRRSMLPPSQTFVECKLTEVLVEAVDEQQQFDACIFDALNLLSGYVTPTLGMQKIIVLSISRLVAGVVGAITSELSMVNICLLPNSDVVAISLELLNDNDNDNDNNNDNDNENKISLTYFGLFKANAPKRVGSWFQARIDHLSVVTLHFSIYADGPKHAFAPSEPILVVQSAPGEDHKMVPDLHYVSTLYYENIKNRRKSLPTDDIDTVGSVASDIKERVDELEGIAGVQAMNHNIQTIQQDNMFQKEKAEICSARSKSLNMVLGIWDFKQNVALTSKYNLLKKNYYNIPTAAFFGIVLIFCKDGVPRVLNLDFTSPSHEKSAAWVAAATEVTYGLRKTRVFGETWNDALGMSQEEWEQYSIVMSGNDVFEEAKVVMRAAHVISYWGDNGSPFHSGILISAIMAGLPAGDLKTDTTRRIPVNCIPLVYAEEEVDESKICRITMNSFAAGEGKNQCDAHFANCETHKKWWTRQHPLDASIPSTYLDWLAALGDTDTRGLRNTGVLILSKDAIEDYETNHQYEYTAERLMKFMQFSTPFIHFVDRGVVNTVEYVVPDNSAMKAIEFSTIKSWATNTLLELNIVECTVINDGAAGEEDVNVDGIDAAVEGDVNVDGIDAAGEGDVNVDGIDAAGEGDVGEGEEECSFRAKGLQLIVHRRRSVTEMSTFKVNQAGRGYLVGDIITHSSGVQFKITSMKERSKYTCDHGCVMGSRYSSVSNNMDILKDVMVIPLKKPTLRDKTNRMRSAPLGKYLFFQYHFISTTITQIS